MSNPSASPSYSDGDVIFVDPDVAIVHGDRVVANYNNGQEVVFRQFMQDGGRKYLKALNPDWRPRFTEIDGSTDICGKVIGKWVAD
jgi:SOS-response transcriptional repressor LexA